MIAEAMKSLQTYDWGDDPSVLGPIEAAIIASHDDAAARSDLEIQLVTVLEGSATRSGKDFVCRTLKIMGTERSVPVLTAMLSDENLSHMARYALESMPNAAAGSALRDALPGLAGKLKAGVIGSLGVRQDTQCVSALAALVGDDDAIISQAAAHALAAIRTPEAATALLSVTPNPSATSAVTDALMACAEHLLNQDDKRTALAIYNRVSSTTAPKHVKLAATRGKLACAAK